MAAAKLKEFVKLVKGARSGKLDSIDEEDTDSASPKSLEREFLRSKWAPGWVESREGGWEECECKEWPERGGIRMQRAGAVSWMYYS